MRIQKASKTIKEKLAIGDVIGAYAMICPWYWSYEAKGFYPF